MKYNIHNDLNSKDLKDKFKAYFRGLKIELFKHEHEEEEGSAKKDLISSNVPLREITSKLKSAELEITEQMTVEDVEHLFEEIGLHVQVFRLMGNNWIETTKTDNYTLARHINMSKETLGLK